jgi:hypothetical protein
MQFRGSVRDGRDAWRRLSGADGRLSGWTAGGWTGVFMIVGGFDRIATETAHDHEATDADTRGRP